MTLWAFDPPPPTPPWLWQATHDLALKTGPSPSPWASGSFGCHSRVNSSCPAWRVEALAHGPNKTGSPGEKCHRIAITMTASRPMPNHLRWDSRVRRRMTSTPAGDMVYWHDHTPTPSRLQED